MHEQFSVRVTWDVLVSSPLHGCRGCILADGWSALGFALHRGESGRPHSRVAWELSSMPLEKLLGR